MPTILFVSASLSLLLATDPDNPQHHERSRKDVMQLMILHLLKKLPDYDLVALYEFSAHDTQCSVPFTADHSSIRRRIYQITLHERGPLGPALEKLVDDVAYSFPMRTKIQVVLFTDGRCFHGWEDAGLFRPNQLTDPGAVDDQAMENLCAFIQKINEKYSIHFNVVCIATPNDSRMFKAPYHRLTSFGNGHLCFIELPNANIKSHIDDFHDRVFPVYTGCLQLGLENLLNFRADPDPNSVAWDEGYHWQSNLPIKGFLLNEDAVYSTISHHFIHGIDPSDSSYAKLALSLRHSGRVALVELDSKRNWAGILRWIAPNSLVMDVLDPRSIFPLLQSNLSECDCTTSNRFALKEPSYMVQYQDRAYVSLNHDAVLRDFSKLSKLITTANVDPAPEMSSVCDEIRKRADKFFCPSLISALVDFLNVERRHLSQEMQAFWLEPLLASLQNTS